jgi:hypothetical protein
MLTIRTKPAVPSTSTIAPSGMRDVASTNDTTQGTPSSRATMAAWLPMAPTLQMTALQAMNKGDHDGSVVRHTSTSPGWISADAGSNTTRTRPDACPGDAGAPRSTSPAAAGTTAEPPLGDQSWIGGGPVLESTM